MTDGLVLMRKRKDNNQLDVVKILVGDEVELWDTKFKITYVRENPYRITLEPKAYTEQEQNGAAQVEVKDTAERTEVSAQAN